MGEGKSILCKLKIHNWRFVSSKIVPLSCSGKNSRFYLNQYKCSRCGKEMMVAQRGLKKIKLCMRRNEFK
jgi:hypothetical protein